MDNAAMQDPVFQPKVRTSNEFLEAQVDPEILERAREMAFMIHFDTNQNDVYLESIVERMDPWFEDRESTRMVQLDDYQFGVRSISHRE